MLPADWDNLCITMAYLSQGYFLTQHFQNNFKHTMTGNRLQHKNCKLSYNTEYHIVHLLLLLLCFKMFNCYTFLPDLSVCGCPLHCSLGEFGAVEQVNQTVTVNWS